MSHTDGYDRVKEAMSEIQRGFEHLKEAFERYDEKLSEKLNH